MPEKLAPEPQLPPAPTEEAVRGLLEWASELVTQLFSILVDILHLLNALVDLRKVIRVDIASPTGSEDRTLFFAETEVAIEQLNAVVRGTTPSVTWTVRYGTDRSATGTEAVTGGTTTTSQTAGSEVTKFDNGTVPAGNWVWLETTAVSGTVQELAVSLRYRDA